MHVISLSLKHVNKNHLKFMSRLFIFGGILLVGILPRNILLRGIFLRRDFAGRDFSMERFNICFRTYLALAKPIVKELVVLAWNFKLLECYKNLKKTAKEFCSHFEFYFRKLGKFFFTTLLIDIASLKSG